MWLLVAPRAAKVLMVMRASGSSRPILASTPRNGVVTGSQPETTARKSSRRLTRRCPVALHAYLERPRSRAAPGANALPLRSELFDPKRHHVARLEIDRGRLLPHTDTRRRTRRDDVARQQRHDPVNVADQGFYPENHRLGIAGLHPLAIDVEPHVKRLRVSQLVCRDENGSNRAEGVEAFALVPGAAALKLIFALRHIVHEAIACNIVQRLMFLDVTGRPAHDDAEFNLPIALG